MLEYLLMTVSCETIIIEDEQGLRESIEAYFTEAGNVCEVATNYASAREKIYLYRYDYILLNITLLGGSDKIITSKNQTPA